MSRPLVLVVAALALTAGFFAPGVVGAIGLFVAAAVLPGLALAGLLLPAASVGTRAVVGLALGPLVASLLAIGPFAAGVEPRAIVLVLGLAGAALLGLGARRPRGAAVPAPGPGLDAAPSRAIVLFVLAMALLVTVPAMAHEWARVKGDAWIHAGIVHQILERGVPPEDPRWAGLTLNYVWFFNFFVALLAGVRGSDPFVFMVLLNAADLVAFLGLVFLAAWTVWGERRSAAAAVVLATVGLNAGAWLLWPLRGLTGLTGSVHGPAAVAEALRPPEILSWRVLYELQAPFAHMVNFLDKFLIGTALNYAWVMMMLVVWALLAWTRGGPRPLLLLGALGAAGMLWFHGVVGLSVLPVLGLTLVLALLLTPWAPWLPSRGRLVAFGLALVAGGLAALPYTRAISKGWSAEQTGVTHAFIVLAPWMAWTLLTSCGIVLALAVGPARRLVAGHNGAGTLLVGFLVAMTGFALVVNLPLDNESKFAFQVFFAAVIVAAAAVEPALAGLERRVGRPAAWAIVGALFVLPGALTLVGTTFDQHRRTEERANVPPAEKRFYAWLAAHTPPDAVVVDHRFRDLAMVRAGRQLYCGSPDGPDKAGLPVAEGRERHAVMADLYGPAPRLDEDAAKLARFGRPVYVIVRAADFAAAPGPPALDRTPGPFRRVHDADGFVVYALDPASPGGS